MTAKSRRKKQSKIQRRKSDERTNSRIMDQAGRITGKDLKNLQASEELEKALKEQ